MSNVASPKEGNGVIKATTGLLKSVTAGEYPVDCGITRGNDSHGMTGPGFAGHRYHPENEARLWKDSLKMSD